MSEDRKQQVLEIIAHVTRRPVAELAPTTDLTDLDVGSAEAMELLAQLEDDFGVEISEVEAAKIRTIQDVLDATAGA